MNVFKLRKYCDIRGLFLALIIACVIYLLKVTFTKEPTEGGNENILRHHSNAVHEFLLLMMSAKVKVCLIEPSILFSMLSSVHKDLLMRRGFNISDFIGVENIVTLAVTEKYAVRLENDSINFALKSSGFRHWTLHSNNANIVQWSNRPIHHIYVRDDQVIHVVVFYQRSEYFWYGDFMDIPKEVQKIIKTEDLLFGHYAAAFEKFTEIPVNLTEISLYFYIPSNPQHFLFQIPTSRFLECNSSAIPSNVTLSKNKFLRRGFSFAEFKRRTLIALQELKKRFHPRLISFWIACGSLLGWYRECNLLEHTTDVDFGAWAADATEDLVMKFRNKPPLIIKERMGLEENGLEYSLDCYGLKVDIFFFYDDGNNFWCAIHRLTGGYFYRLLYPKFTLCSAELLGHKVLVPCQTESVIRAEYGPDWKIPVTEWDFISSPFNRGLKYYWTDNERQRAYIKY